jgi:D-lyxose ketol-isomerase
MISRQEYEKARRGTLEMLTRAGIVLTSEEVERIEVADCGLGDLIRLGLEVVTYVNTERVCAKELVMTSFQMFPEHLHPPVSGEPGKEETFRCRWGEIYLYVSGEPTPNPRAQPPEDYRPYLKVWREVVLHPGEQYTLYPGTPHWFQAGPQGAVVSEFSTRSRDESDIFTDPRIRRLPEVAEA